MMTAKPEECEGCPMLVGGKEPKPVVINYEEWHKDVNGNIDVLFVGHVFNKIAGEPFDGNAGRYLRNYIDKYDVAHYGITNIYKCRLAHQTNHAWTCQPGKRCRDIFINELGYNPRLIVTLGSPVLLVLTNMTVGEVLDDGTVINLRGREFSIIALPHPSPLHTYNDKVLLECWDRRWLVIAKFLKKEVLSGVLI